MLHAPPMRPRFRVELPLPPDELLDRLVEPIEARDPRIEGMVAGQHVEWMIPRAERHFWSPRLSLEVREDTGSCWLYGLFGPRPSVWTLFALGYGLLAFAGLTAIFFGASQWTIGVSPWALWVVPGCGVAALLLYGFSLFGQRLAAEEMDRLRGLLSEQLAAGADHEGEEPRSPGEVDSEP